MGPPEPEILTAIRSFLAEAEEPAVLEPGHEQIRVSAGGWSVQVRGPRLLLEAWDETRNLCRPVTAIRGRERGSLELGIERFGGREGQLFLLDLARLRHPETERRGRRMVFREQVRRWLSRQFPGWTIAEIGTERFLEASLGETCVRAFLKNGTIAWAAVAARPDPRSAACALTCGLVWLDYLRVREARLQVGGLALFLPAGHEAATCLRLKWLNPNAARFDVFVYSEEGYEEPVDPALYTNVDTRLVQAAAASARERIAATPEAELEAAVAAAPDELDASLAREPVYSQVTGSAGTERGITDLLATDRAGRLAVLELKSSEDIHLPIQALDYWIRILWHLERDEFSSHGYFPGVELRRAPPRLFLVAPALCFHPKSETILRYFAPSVDVVRIGVAPRERAVEWRQGLKVMFRIPGSQRPA